MDNKNFELVYKKCFKILFYYILRIVSNEKVAEDIAQEVFLEFWEKRKSIDQSVPPEPYLYTIAYHKSIDHLRRSNTYNIHLSNFRTYLDNVFYNTFISEENIDVKDMEKVIKRAIMSLSPKCKEVFLLSRENGLKNTQIANTLNINTKTVEKHITNAIKHIKLVLEEMGFLLSIILIIIHLSNGR